MPSIRLDELEVWSKLGKNMHNKSGQLLLAKGTTLEPAFIERLQALGFEEVFLEDEVEVPRPHFLQPNQALVEVLSICEQSIDELMVRINAGLKPNISEVKAATNVLFDEVAKTNNVLQQLRTLRETDRYTLQHSVAVSIISMKIGQLLSMNDESLRRLTLAGMLHDIGKSRVPINILNKPGPLSVAEREEMNKHPQYGYQVLRAIDFEDHAVELAVLQHHERLDGHGYPMHFPSEKLHDFSKIVAVADIFDAMTSDRVYRPRVSPFEAADELKSLSFGQIDPKITRKFLGYIINITPGEAVILNTGESAEIVMVDTTEPNRPLVRVGDVFINLKEHRNLFIKEMIQPA